MARRQSRETHLVEVEFLFDEKTHVSVANRIVAIVGKMFYASNRVLGFRFSSERKRTEALKKMADITDVHGSQVVSYRVDAEQSGPAKMVDLEAADTWTCCCGYQNFRLMKDGSVVCWTCEKVADFGLAKREKS